MEQQPRKKNDTPATHRTRSLQKGFTKQREKIPVLWAAGRNAGDFSSPGEGAMAR